MIDRITLYRWSERRMGHEESQTNLNEVRNWLIERGYIAVRIGFAADPDCGLLIQNRNSPPNEGLMVVIGDRLEFDRERRTLNGQRPIDADAAPIESYTLAQARRDRETLKEIRSAHRHLRALGKNITPGEVQQAYASAARCLDDAFARAGADPTSDEADE